MDSMLFATDFSPGSRVAERRLRRLLARSGARVHVLHVLAPGTGEGLPGGWAERVRTVQRDEARAALDALAADLAPAATRELRAGKAFVEIVRCARERGAQLVVLGPHAGGPRAWSFGTTAERVIRKGDRPVLVARGPAETDYQRVLVGVDFSAPSAAVIRAAGAIAPGARLVLIHVYDDWFVAPMRRGGAEEAAVDEALRETVRLSREALARLAAEAGLEAHVERRVRAGYPGRTLVDQAAELDADLVVVGASGAGTVPQLLFGSVAEHVVREVPGDVLVVRTGAEPGFELP